MLNELNILYDNIKKFRKPILTEGVGEQTIIDAINNHKIIHMYYAGDDTVLKGYRTVRPFVLGKHKKTGNILLRAWQDAGNSDGYSGIGRTPRIGHEKIHGPKGMQPGWRLFNVDYITSFVPVGQKFTPREFFNIGDIKYNPNDSAMSNIIAAIEITPKQGISVDTSSSVDDPNISTRKIKDKTFDTQTSKFKQFFKAAEKSRNATKKEVDYWWNLVRDYWKKSPRNYYLIQNEKGDIVTVTKTAVENNRVNKNAIIGNLQDLYNKMVVEPQPYSNDFAKKREKMLKNNLKNK